MTAPRTYISELSASEQQSLVKLILAFINDEVVARHPVITASGAEFLAAHRQYVRELEVFLKANGGGVFVPLPAWDPALPIPVAFSVVKPGAKAKVRPSLANTNPGLAWPELLSPPGLFAHPSPADMAESLREWLAAVFKAVGGSLASNALAAAAPVFWTASALVNEINRKYQDGQKCCCCCCCECCDGSGDSGKCGGEIILFEHDNFHGRHKHVYRAEPNLNYWEDHFFNDRTSSIAVIEGNWQIFADSEFIAPFPVVLGPGLYTLTKLREILAPAGAPPVPVGVINDQISSLRPTTAAPNYNGHRPPPQIEGHIILFIDANLHGSHKHVFRGAENNPEGEANLNNYDERWPFNEPFTPTFGLPPIYPFHPMHAYFNDRVSSAVVLMGQWELYEHANYNGSTGAPLGVGIHPIVANDTISSVRCVGVDLAVPPPQIVLLEHINFRGVHKHLFRDEANLNQTWPDLDNFFNDRASSIAVRSGQWQCFEHADYGGIAYPVLNPGCYPVLTTLGIRSDDISSVRLF